jgi:hypothetical protein
LIHQTGDPTRIVYKSHDEDPTSLEVVTRNRFTMKISENSMRESQGRQIHRSVHMMEISRHKQLSRSSWPNDPAPKSSNDDLRARKTHAQIWMRRGANDPTHRRDATHTVGCSFIFAGTAWELRRLTHGGSWSWARLVFKRGADVLSTFRSSPNSTASIVKATYDTANHADLRTFVRRRRSPDPPLSSPPFAMDVRCYFPWTCCVLYPRVWT